MNEFLFDTKYCLLVSQSTVWILEVYGSRAQQEEAGRPQGNDSG